jgi:hypothetical protein
MQSALGHPIANGRGAQRPRERNKARNRATPKTKAWAIVRIRISKGTLQIKTLQRRRQIREALPGLLSPVLRSLLFLPQKDHRREPPH